jgi:hypothetical protein
MILRSTVRALPVALLVVVVASGCGGPGSTTATSPTTDQLAGSSEVTDSNGMRSGVIPSSPVAPPSDADRPDGPSPTPDDKLTVNDLRALVRTPASAGSTVDSCSADEVSLALSGIDAAAGHRYAQLIATNTSSGICTLSGWPGLGLRGAWGSSFPIVVDRSSMQVDRVGLPGADPATAVTLASGGRAAAEFEWTGALAGTRDEPVSLIAVQLSADGDPAAFVVEQADRVDLGPETTVRVGPWGPAG